LDAGSYEVEWFDVKNREAKRAGTVTVEASGNTSFIPPFPEIGPAVLYLKRIER
jgi:hypothetical protein